MLTGRLPFEASSPFALPDLQRRGVGDAFFKMRPDLNLEVGHQLGRGLHLTPGERPLPVSTFSSSLADAITSNTGNLQLARWWAQRKSRRSLVAGAVSLAAASAAAGWAVRDRFAPLTEDERIIRYNGGMTPEANSFRRAMDLYIEFRAEPGRPGFRSATLFTKSQGYVSHQLTDRQKRAAFNLGWRMRALVRPELGRIGMLLDAANHAPRFDVFLERTDKGFLAIAGTHVQEGMKGISLPLNDPGAGVLIEVKVQYDPSTESAIVHADGQMVTTNYRGHLEYRENTGMMLFVDLTDPAESRGILGSASFEILG